MDTFKFESFEEVVFALEGRLDVEFLLHEQRGWIGAHEDRQLCMCGFPNHDSCVIFDTPDEVLDYDLGGGDTLRNVWLQLDLISL